MPYDYFYEEQSEQFSFYRIPKALVSLSRKNRWVDAAGRVYIYYTLNSIMEDVGCAVQKAVKLLGELEKYGLIERVRQGQGRPSRIYVKNFLPPLRNSKNKDFENHSSETSKTKVQGLRISKGNNTEKNNTDMNDTNRILSGMGCDDDSREQYREYFREKLAIEDLKERYPYDRETLDGIEELILDVVCSGKKTIRVQGENFPAGVVKSRFMKLRFDHIEYVMEQLQKTTTDIRNIRQYRSGTISPTQRIKRRQYKMKDIHFETNLDPLKDGMASTREDLDRLSRHAVIIGTNGRYRKVSMKEAGSIMESMQGCSATMLVGEENFAVVYNVEKTFRMDGNIFLVGSFLVMKMEGQRMFPLSDRDLGRLFMILAGKMEEFRNGDEVFDALRIE